jgi:predicted transcriptional regulator
LELLDKGEKSGKEIAEHLGTEQISTLLNKLAKEKLIKAHPDGVKKFWSLVK